MIRRIAFAVSLALLLMSCAHENMRRPSGSPDDSAVARIAAREFPSIFQAWAPAENLNSTFSSAGTGGKITPMTAIEPPLTTIARHDLVWRGPTTFGLEWNNPQSIGLASDFTPASIPKAMSVRAQLLTLNPQIVLLAEIRYHDAQEGYLPDDSPWWLRDAKGNRVPAKQTVPGTWYLLDYNNVDLQNQIVEQCLAVVRTRALDGCMLDWWSTEDTGRLTLIKKIRLSIGDDAILLVNVNQTQPIHSAPYINGMYMEGLLPRPEGGLFDWSVAAANLLWAKDHLRAPAFTALDAWAVDPAIDMSSLGRNDVSRMRFATTLSLTHSDGFVLFADPNSLPTPDHLHDWYPFWTRVLGHPLPGPLGARQADGSILRDFDHGRVICNPPGNAPVRIHFPTPVTAAGTGLADTDFVVPAGDGEIFIK